MCPSYRATRNERDVTRGRANSLRLALAGQLGKQALASDEMAETMKFCVSCKACKSECPMSIDMAKMKIETLAAGIAERGLSLSERAVAYLPRYARPAARARWVANLPRHAPGFLRAAMGFAGDRRGAGIADEAG